MDKGPLRRGNGPAPTCPQGDPCNLVAAVEDASVVDGDRVLVLPGPYALVNVQITVDDDIAIQPASGLPKQTVSTTWS